MGFKVHDGHGAVGVSVTPEESLCDGKFHSVTGMTLHALYEMYTSGSEGLNPPVTFIQCPNNLK